MILIPKQGLKIMYKYFYVKLAKRTINYDVD